MKRFTTPKVYTLSSILLLAVILTGCGGGNQQKEKSTSANYNETKQMVVDILKTKEGKKAIKEATKGNRMSTQSIQGGGNAGGGGDGGGGQGGGGEGSGAQIQQMMQDPKFANSMAKAMQEENKKLIKDLMKDPEYQKMMLNVMKDPEYQRMVLETMKSPAYRQQTMTIMKESLQSPMFRLEMINIAQKAQEQMIKPEQGKGKEKEGKQGGQGGQGGKGQGGQGGGGGGGGGGQ
ncbi:hypothetical protein AM501_13735 [Aneurinibacillus migulanus]|jgi:spore germination protein D|uniref:Spore germination protein D n=1 Tax=Aneurinibacillus migulanus TaxID=47500 RepID=A0A0D1XTM8_ANEMI|nr:spore germination lipoprotein GerD [Aneurinibacillus migulanus]KIV52962.1 hypothetical protein TS64_20775 [Aneurinibacillus migulanus]KIV55503.1 hypothetical protein TS65_16180 [Aneurinibacillus migulanus]KON90710.1 hypothetical protein AF333_27075 [Aneurinibacillus migulanus]KPD07817.1 hypothetical protein AM501_13735 [Aneurinibacillus migulanus]MCP1358000.1 spore germination lipoprotein GerD [Aneurinibacillus migulanus]